MIHPWYTFARARGKPRYLTASERIQDTQGEWVKGQQSEQSEQAITIGRKRLAHDTVLSRGYFVSGTSTAYPTAYLPCAGYACSCEPLELSRPAGAR